jgi:exonuclease SbcC
MGFKRLLIPEAINFSDGRMLIFGRNESGKSTVMEAIHYGLFGLALRPNKRASNDDLINYGYPQAVVELAFTIDDNEYHVKRILKRRGTNIHELVVHRPDGKRERVTGARVVRDMLLEELHGIDSEAMLNSCLVEQKELGKLEDSVRAKRIEAMTSLLNIETFVEAQQDLKNSSRELDRKNQETAFRLEKAEQAKKDYEGAEEKREKAQSRIEEIVEELDEAAKTIGELEEILKVIDRVKEINSDTEKRTERVEGLRGELSRIEDSLREAVEAEALVIKIEEELPSARSRFDEAEIKNEALELLLKLQSQLENARGEEKRSRERLKEADDKVREAEEAHEQVQKLNEQIEDYEPAREAQKILPRIESLSQDINTARAEIKRLKREETDIESRLESLADAEKRILHLEEREENLRSEKKASSQKRSVGLASAFIGLIALIGYNMNQVLLPVGAALLLLGIVLVIRYLPGKYDASLGELKEERETLLGEKTRIQEYQQSLEETVNMLGENEERLQESEADFEAVISELPSSPNEYSEIVDSREKLPNSIGSLRNTIQEDLRTLVQLTTKRDEKNKIADDLEQRHRDKKSQSVKLENYQSEIESLEQQSNDIETEQEITLEQADSIKAERDEAQKKVQGLETNLETYHKKAALKEKLESDSKKVQRTIKSLENEIEELEAEKNQLFIDNEVDLSKEEEFRMQNEDLVKRSASLETEKSERTTDVEEAEEAMAATLDLKNEYPKLVEQDEKEKFEFEAMRRAIILLDTTRDGIMGGVKKRIESHMVHFLPALTDQRYNMARIDEKDYRIEVYDREAKRWRVKGVFSGATQDQFSLALRLAFALSTIPSSRGARPGFIFLDEPLSGFDLQRRKGFMHLLQEELPKYFDQIIVISHLEALQEEFPNHLQLEAGQIITTNI